MARKKEVTWIGNSLDLTRYKTTQLTHNHLNYPHTTYI